MVTSGIQIAHPQELESKLSEALEQVRNNRLVFVDVTVDGSEHVYPMQIRGGGMDEMWLSKTEKPDYAPDIISLTRK